MTGAPVYESDPDPRPDEEFEQGALAHLVVGNCGRLLDGRRTPVRVAALLPEVGMFEVEITAFEDVGARWQLELEQVDRFQFERGEARLRPRVVEALEAAVTRFDAITTIAADPAQQARTERRIADLRPSARQAVRPDHPADALETFLGGLGLAELDAAFAERWVSNPASGELVKGHAMVLARLGLCPYHGKAQRSRELFRGDWSDGRRAAHVIARLAFVRELYGALGFERVVLHRGVSAERPLELPRPRSFVSATFDERVAEAHFAGAPGTVASALYRQAIPVERLFMTHAETRALGRRFRESEAVLLGDENSPLF